MYVSSNIVCFVVDLHVIVNYIKMLSAEQEC